MLSFGIDDSFQELPKTCEFSISGAFETSVPFPSLKEVPSG